MIRKEGRIWNTMISPDILMEILHYNQVYNICIEITWVVGRGSHYRIQKASSNKKEKKTKPLLLYRLGAELGCQTEGGRPAAEGRGLPAAYPGDLRQPPWRSMTCRHRLLGQDTHQAAAAAVTSNLVKSLDHPRFSLPDHLEHTTGKIRGK